MPAPPAAMRSQIVQCSPQNSNGGSLLVVIVAFAVVVGTVVVDTGQWGHTAGAAKIVPIAISSTVKLILELIDSRTVNSTRVSGSRIEIEN